MFDRRKEGTMTTTLSSFNSSDGRGDAPTVRNLLFPNGGTAAYPAINEALVSMKEPTIVTLGPDTETTTEHFVLYPGSFLPTALAKAIKFAVIEQFALPTAELDELLCGGFGFHPLPNPRFSPVQDTSANPEFSLLSHPVYWLPVDVRDADFWADPRFAPWREPLEQIRLWMELFIRGVVDMERGDFIDILAAAGLDPVLDAEAIQEAHRCSLSGEPNELLVALTVPEPQDAVDYGPATRLIAATFAIDFVRNNMDMFRQVELDVINSRSLYAMELFRSIEGDDRTTVADQMVALEQATRELMTAPGSKEDFDAFESWVMGRVDVIGDILEETYVPLVSMLTLRRNNFDRGAPEFARIEQAFQSMFDEVDALEERIESLVDSMRAASGQQRSTVASEIWNAIGAMMTKVITATDEVWETAHEAGFTKDADWEIAPPPFLAVPDEAKAGLTRWFAERGTAVPS